MMLQRPLPRYPSRPLADGERWLAQIFAAKAVRTGGVVRRCKRDVDRRIGLERLEREVRRRGFHLVECENQYMILCDRGAIRVLC